MAATTVLLLAPLPAAAAPAVEGFAPYVGQSSCDPVARPGTVALSAYVLKTYRTGRSGGIVRNCNGSPSEHMEGRAWDWMLDAFEPAEKRAGDRFAAWLTAKGPDGDPGYNARRLGVMYLIWDKEQWSAYRAADGWRAYRGASPHTDHVHVSLSWNGAMGRTSFWTGRTWPTDYGPCRTVAGRPAPKHVTPRLTPCPAPTSGPRTTPAVPSGSGLAGYAGTTLREGDTGPAVAALQARLRLQPDGRFGPGTRAAVVAFQRSRRLTADGVVGRGTWLALAQGTKPVTRPPVVVVRPVSAPSGKPATGLAAHAGTTLRLGATGPAVKALQTRLRLRPDGAFGPATQAAVVAFQRSRRLPADGVVGRATWLALAGGPQPTRKPPARPVPVKRPVPVQAPAASAKAGLAPYAGTTLRKGATGPAVKALQTRLRLRADGRFGPATEAAVVAFQRSRRLPPDGVVGRATWAALRA